MNATQIELVQSSFAKVAPIAPKAAEIFYNKLFEKDPSLKPMFKGDMTEQGAKLMSMLGAAVNGLKNLDALVPTVQDLAKRHAGYGVTAQMYETVGAALIETLEAGLGEDFTPDVKDAWVEVYTLLSTTMIAAAEEEVVSEPVEEGPISSKDIKLVQDSFEKVVPIADKAAEIFYGKLFEKDPSLKAMFKGDMAEQGKKLMTMIQTAVNGLNNLDAIVPAVQGLGQRHAGYGVTDSMYDTVGTSLIETLEAGLGDDFTEDTKTAWVNVYTLLATTMKDAAASAPASTPTPAETSKWWQFWK